MGGAFFVEIGVRAEDELFFVGFGGSVIGGYEGSWVAG